MADQKKVELGREDAAELRCARLEVEARAAEYRESLRVLEGLRLQAEHLALLSTRCAENLAREGAVAQQRAEAHALARAAMAARQREVGERLAPGSAVDEAGVATPLPA